MGEKPEVKQESIRI